MNFTEKICFDDLFGSHLESEGWKHHSSSVFGLANASEVPHFE